jgi:hypothetical protein
MTEMVPQESRPTCWVSQDGVPDSGQVAQLEQTSRSVLGSTAWPPSAHTNSALTAQRGGVGPIAFAFQARRAGKRREAPGNSGFWKALERGAPPSIGGNSATVHLPTILEPCTDPGRNFHTVPSPDTGVFPLLIPRPDAIRKSCPAATSSASQHFIALSPSLRAK